MIKKSEFKAFAKACRKDILNSPLAYDQLEQKLLLSIYDSVITLLVTKLEKHNDKSKGTKK